MNKPPKKHMKRQQLLEWTAKTIHVNEGKTLKVGDRVVVGDMNLEKGTVVKINRWDDDGEALTAEKHGTVYIKFDNPISYLDDEVNDNTESYSFYGWEQHFRIID